MGVKVSFLNERPAAAPTSAPRARILVPESRDPDGGRQGDSSSSSTRIASSSGPSRSAPPTETSSRSRRGCSGGEQVVIDPPATLVDGAKVAIKER